MADCQSRYPDTGQEERSWFGYRLDAALLVVDGHRAGDEDRIG
ncbi:MAG TPA: hypothetical protein VK604_27725 [Bryobacteraceae bacterium]|nr:hypothetical protein [Bryobacteraceae bacterium]